MLENINTEQVILIAQLIGFMVVVFGLMWGFTKYNNVKNSVGWGFISSISAVKRRNKFDLVLRIKSPAGKEDYLFVKQSPIIKYPYRENGKDVEKSVIYDEKAIDYLNGCPILNVTPLDIRPIDRDTGLFVTIPGEIIEKLAVDSSRNAEEKEKYDKERKMMIYALIGMCALFIIAISYLNQTNSELQQQLAQVTIEAVKSANVIAG